MLRLGLLPIGAATNVTELHVVCVLLHERRGLTASVDNSSIYFYQLNPGSVHYDYLSS